MKILNGARGRSRTGTVFLPRDFKLTESLFEILLNYFNNYYIQQLKHTY
jgi:hypothetical protein